MSYQMKDVTKKTNLTEKAIRLYIDKGLISPVNKVDSGKNHYYFEEEQVQELKEIALLRAFRFSLQDILYIFHHDDRIGEVLDRHTRIMEAEGVLQKMWNCNAERRKEIHSKSELIEYLSVSKSAFEYDRLYGNLFQHMEDEYVPQENKATFKIRYLMIIIIFMAGIIMGGLFVRYHMLAVQEASQRKDDFLYAIEEQMLCIKNVEWKEYPGFRKVSFEMSGTFIMNVPKGDHCVLQNLSDESLLAERDRETFCVSNGSDVLFYDRVEYRLKTAAFQSQGLLKKEEEVSDAMQGYRVTVCIGEHIVILGYIPPLCEKYYEWSNEENECAKYNYEKYLPNFSLSKTYEDNEPTARRAPDIYLRKEEGGIFNCIIDNTEGNRDWEFNAGLPTIELWYQGVWIAVNSPFSDNLMLNVCRAGERKEISVPPETTAQFSYFLPGIYRLVLWGADNDFIISESFTIGENENETE